MLTQISGDRVIVGWAIVKGACSDMKKPVNRTIVFLIAAILKWAQTHGQIISEGLTRKDVSGYLSLL